MAIVFYILAAVLAAGVAFLLARTLMRPMAAPPGAAEHGQAVYRDQLAELDRDVARGLMSPQEEDAVRAEISRRMLAAGRAAGAERTAADAPPARRLAIVALLVPLAAVGVYLAVGAPGAQDRPLAARIAAGETRSAASTTEMESALAELSGRLRDDPSDFETRVLLGRVLFRLQRYAEALEHYERAIELTEGGDNTEIKNEYAQARVMANEGAVDRQAFEAFRDVLEADPENPEARFYLGLAAAQGGEYELAFRVWQDLMADSPPDAPWLPALREQIMLLQEAAAEQAAGGNGQAPADSGAD